MQEKGSVKGEPGASGYAPGHQMQEKGSVKGTTGASGYAPGHATTGSGVKSDVDVKANTSGAGQERRRHQCRREDRQEVVYERTLEFA